MNKEIDFDLLKKYKIFIATPMYGGNSQAEYTASLSNLTYFLGKYNIEYEFSALYNESLIQRGRNILVKKFLESNFDILFFIDADVGFNAYDVFYMMQMMVTSEDKKILCGTYPFKKINWDYINAAYNNGFIKNPEDAIDYSSSFVLNFEGQDGEQVKFRTDEPLKVRESGTGFMMIHKEVFDKFKTEYPEQYVVDSDGKTELFYYFDCKIHPKTKQYLSEDYMFCQYASKIGYDTWVLPYIELSHSGLYVHRGSFAKNSIMYYKLYMENN
jgi:hypothetical protein